MFRLITVNGFPAEGTTQVYLTDTNYFVIDSLISNPNDFFIASGAINGQGRVVTPTKKIVDVIKNQQDVKKWVDSKVRYIIVRGTISTPNNGTTNVKIYRDNTLDVRLGFRVKANISPDEL